MSILFIIVAYMKDLEAIWLWREIQIRKNNFAISLRILKIPFVFKLRMVSFGAKCVLFVN